MLCCLAILLAAASLAAVFVTVPVTVEAAGSLEPVRVFRLKAQVSGVIDNVVVAEGDTVHIGQPLVFFDSLLAVSALAELDAETEAQQVEADRLARTVPIEREQANVALLQANARLLRSRAALRQRLIDFGISAHALDSVLVAYVRGTHVSIDGAIADVEVAAADVAGARIQLARAELLPLETARQNLEVRRLSAQAQVRRAALKRSVLHAPMNGVVLTELPEQLAGTAIREGDTVLELADLADWRAVVLVRERDVNRIRGNDRAYLEIPALAPLYDEPLRARVVRVAAELHAPDGSGSVGGIRGYRVYLALDRAQLNNLDISVDRRGYSVQAKIVTRRVLVSRLIREWLNERVRRAGL
jgi:multidrug resistance efflux pump